MRPPRAGRSVSRSVARWSRRRALGSVAAGQVSRRAASRHRPSRAWAAASRSSVRARSAGRATPGRLRSRGCCPRSCGGPSRSCGSARFRVSGASTHPRRDRRSSRAAVKAARRVDVRRAGRGAVHSRRIGQNHQHPVGARLIGSARLPTLSATPGRYSPLQGR